MNPAGGKAATIYVMAGGTGGHVIPALAVAKRLADQGFDIRWLGTPAGIEAKLVPDAGFAIDWLAIGGLRGKGWMTRLTMPFRLLRAVLHARQLFARHKPVLVVGMGGYAAGPGGLAAWWLGIPLIVHEQNAVAGLTNRVLARLARDTLSAYVGAFSNPPKHFTVVGNPVRPDIVALPAPRQRLADRTGPVRILVLGGSLGAKALNELVPAALARIGQSIPLSIRHQTGRQHLDATQANYGQSRWATHCDYQVFDFIEDMAEAYGWADFVIARSGALTVAEISAAGIGALFVPFPHAVDDHQTRNAQGLVQADAAYLIQQRDLTVAGMVDVLTPVLADRDRLREMAVAARSKSLPKATETIVRICIEALGQPRLEGAQ
ncbi:undecaprenyldiphospho-muramoylpentapeptide beta-N-acetylglucosaminyltransferase [Halothiobacillus diazotrophicus]|uniref:UDP-N-acetylglucosamine--N-acetylmuramyl-(pentapeptide) pyrophosphoryl-undecaprenol N-acetylglucosamine transferase n=1 Tax=Halothiobacillus diazotrophicus TaxID=1860122 RepID=A0A191ZJC0_9GAMM|nr:undecaprenyldiphospho-muramoylpentapeptide beta-N-acetylglucosaminyltransferase [Halothiobacillus diazotrophicus]ANJ67942.1 undecaprenyldiphospho-muramoylpentapeptide beta-N-acetylglucosaminyltransferase [Halothiobacillus diazotrophicus]